MKHSRLSTGLQAQLWFIAGNQCDSPNTQMHNRRRCLYYMFLWGRIRGYGRMLGLRVLRQMELERIYRLVSQRSNHKSAPYLEGSTGCIWSIVLQWQDPAWYAWEYGLHSCSLRKPRMMATTDHACKSRLLLGDGKIWEDGKMFIERNGTCF